MDLRHVRLAGLLACGLAAGCNGLPFVNGDVDSMLADGPRAAPRPFPTAAPVQSGKPVVIESRPEIAAETKKVVASAPQAAAAPATPSLGQIRRDPVAATLANVPPGRIAPQSAAQQAAAPQSAAAPQNPPAHPPTHQTVTDAPAPDAVVVTPAEAVPATDRRPERMQTAAESERLIADVAALLQQEQSSMFSAEKAFPSHWNPPLTQARIHREIQLASSEEPLPPPTKAAKKPVGRVAEESPEEPREEREPEEPAVDDLAQRVETLRGEMIEALEELVRKSNGKLSKEELARLEQELRLAYLSADRMDDAVKKIDSLPESPREAFKHLAFALAQMMPREDDRRPSHRYARTLRSLREASQELSAAGRLELKNLAFCESVEQFGWYHEFKRREFTAGQQMILYVEVDNVTSERKAPQQFETELQGSYQIFNAANQLVGERTLPLDKETCRNWRRDYFLAYRIYLPEELPAGAYRLELSIEDLKAKAATGKKLGEGLLDFTVR